MKTLAFLLLLDFSGSMDQPLQNRTKIEILKEETNSLISTAAADSESVALIFGTEPALGCRDLRSYKMRTSDLATKLQNTRPGALGKTPLALGLRELVSQSIKQNAKSSIVVTDGADSCGQDPCKALEAGDKQLGKAGKKLTVHIIGFDLKNENKKFECLKSLNLENIMVSMSEALSSTDLQRKIREGQMSLLEAGAALKDADTARIKGLQKNAVREKGKGTQVNAKETINGKPIFDPKAEALLEVVGSPATARFSATSKEGKRDWLGSYVMTMKAGSHTVRFDDKNGTELILELGPGTHTRIPWARLMKIFEAQVQVQSPTLALKWIPNEATKVMHGEISDLISQAKMDRSQVSSQKVPFGDWELEVTSPPWLAGKVQNKKAHFGLGRDTQIDLELLYQDQIKWIDNPKPESLQVLRIVVKGKSEERYPIQQGLKRIPIPKEAVGVWMKP